MSSKLDGVVYVETIYKFDDGTLFEVHQYIIMSLLVVLCSSIFLNIPQYHKDEVA